jgi:hypothetical protein
MNNIANGDQTVRSPNRMMPSTVRQKDVFANLAAAGSMADSLFSWAYNATLSPQSLGQSAVDSCDSVEVAYGHDEQRFFLMDCLANCTEHYNKA